MKKRKILSLILALIMTISLFPAVNAQQGGVTERIVPVTAVESLSSALSSSGGASLDISDAVISSPSGIGTDIDVTDAFCRVNKDSANEVYLTVDIGYSAPITKVIVRSLDSTSGPRVTKLWYSTDGVNFSGCAETPAKGQVYRGAEYGMGGYDTKWDLSSAQINARYIRVGAEANVGPLKIQNIIVYTGDEAPSLSSLAVENGTHTLSPSFSADVYDYTVEVENLSELPTLVFAAADGFTAAETQIMSSENGYISKITVTRTGAPTDKKVYTVRAISTEFDTMLPVTYVADGCTAVVDESYCSLDGGIDLSNPSTMYYTSGATNCYTLDLGRIAVISSVRFNQRQNNDATGQEQDTISNATSVAYFEKLEVSADGIDFTDVTVSPTTGIGNDNLYGLSYYQISFDFASPVNARYIRVSNDGDGPLWIRGTEVFGRIFDAENIDYLKDIKLSNDGGVSFTSLDGFNKDTLTYVYNLSQRNIFPQVSGVKAYDGQTVEATQATAEKPYATIKVTSESGSKSREYKINFLYNYEITHEELIKWEITPYYELCSPTREGTLEAAIDCGDDIRCLGANDVDAMYTIDLGMVTDVTKIHYWQGSTAVASDYFETLEISTDGVNFTNVTQLGLVTRKSYGKTAHPVYSSNKWWCVEYAFTAPTLARYIKVSNDDKEGLRIYGIEVYRNIYPAYLKALSIDAGTLSETFDSKVFGYEAIVADFETLPLISAEAEEGCSIIEILQPSAANGYIGSVKVRDNSSGEENIYTVSVKFPDVVSKLNITPYEAGSSIGYKGTLQAGIDGSDKDNGWSSSSAIKPRFAVKTDALSNIKKVIYYQDTGEDIAPHFERICISKNGTDFTDVTEFATRTDIGWDNGENSWGHNYYVTAFEFETPITAMYVRVENNYGNILNLKGTEIYGYSEKVVEPVLADINLSFAELIPQFAPDIYAYEVLVEKIEKLPRIFGMPGFLNTEEVTVLKPSADNSYRGKILVKSNRGASVYVVKMYEDRGIPLEDLTELSVISTSYDNVNYTPLEDFDREVYAYSYPLESLDNIPNVRATATCDGATVEISQATKENPTARIVVTSQSGNVTDVYTVTFTYNIALNQPVLAGSGIPAGAVDGKLSTQWKSNTQAPGGGYFTVLFAGLSRMYSMTLYSPLSKTAYFDQVYVSYDGQNFEKLDDVILVQTGRVTNSDGTSLYEYEYKFPTSYMDVWAVKVRGQDDYYMKNEINELEVYGERLYLVSGDSLLKSLTFDSVVLDDFSPYKQSYSMTIGATDPIPQITSVTAQSAGASYSYVQATEENPVAEVTVTAQNAVSKTTYKIYFVREVLPADNNYLSSITVEKGKMVPQFSKAVNSYTVYIEETNGVLTKSDVYATAEEDSASVTVSDDGNTVTVTSQNGADNIYSITPVYSSSKLTALSASGYTISPQFSPSIINYTVALSDGDAIPKINVADGDKLILAQCSLNATMQIKDATADYPMSVITITDETGYLKSTYTITYVTKQSLTEAQAAVLEKLSQISVFNNTDLSTLAGEITSVITNSDINTIYETPLSRTLATSSSDGKISGSLKLSYGGNDVYVKINLVIAKTGGTGGSTDTGGGGGGGGGGASFPSTTFPDSIVENENTNQETNIADTITKEAQAQIAGHWAEKEATVLAQKGIVKGKDGSYALEDNVTRAEFIAMLVRVFELDELPYNGGFADVSGNEWYAGVISAAHSQGLLNGSGGKAHPNNNITREESVKLLVCFIEKYNGQIESTETAAFEDSVAISEWAEEYVSKAVSGGFINGMGNNEFMPKGTLTRAQAMVMLYRVIFDA